MHNKIPIPNFKLIGHRGIAALRPENSLSGFRFAKNKGLNFIELDTQLSKDEVWVVIHDHELTRTTNAQGLVQDYNAQELTKFANGLWFTPPYPEETVPTLVQALTLAKELQLFCNIELKVPDKATLQYVNNFLAFVKENSNLLANCILSSFDTECAIQLAKNLPNIPVAYLIDHWEKNAIEICKQYNFACINCNFHNITVSDVELAHTNQVPVFLYTINDKTSANYWLEQGVSGVFTDNPDLLLT